MSNNPKTPLKRNLSRPITPNISKESFKQINSETDINKCRSNNNIQTPQVKSLGQQNSERGIHNVQTPQAKTICQKKSEKGILKINSNNHYRSINITQTPRFLRKETIGSVII